MAKKKVAIDVTPIRFGDWLSDRVAETVVVSDESGNAKLRSARADYNKGLEKLLEEFNGIEKSYPNNKSDKNIELLARKLSKGVEYAELRNIFAGVSSEYIIEGFSDEGISCSDDYKILCKLSEDGVIVFDSYTSTTNANIDKAIDGVDDSEYIKRDDSPAYGESEYPDTWLRDIATIDV